MATTPIHKRSPLPGSRTDEGYANKPNEDTFDLFKIGSDPWASDPDDAVYVGIVADGVTSKAGGEQASRIATETIKKTLQRHSPSHLAAQSQQLIDEAIYLANREILEVARKNPEWGSMSTTLVLAAIAGDQLSIAHLGDSRAYLLRGGKLYRLTLDHTWIQEALDLNRITVEEARAHPNRNVIRRYLGINPNIEVDWQIVHPNGNAAAAETRDYTTTVTLQPDDVILLCSDGLTEKVSDDEILTVLNRHKGAPEKAADLLVKRALAKKEQDNITVVLLSYAKRSGLGGWGKWLWVPLLLLLGVFLYTLYTGLGDRLPAEDPAVAVLPAVTATDAPTAVPTAVPPTPAPTVAPLVATTVMTSVIEAEGEARLQPTVGATASEEQPTLRTATPTRDRPTPTRAPDQPTATSTATTAVVGGEVVSQPGVAQEPDSSSSQSSSGASTDASVTLVRPPADTTLAGPATFEFTTGYQLKSGEGFEVVVWQQGGDPMANSYGVANPLVQTKADGRYQVTGDLSSLVIDENGNRLQSGTYQWGILIVRTTSYGRVMHLGGQQVVNYDPGDGGGGNPASGGNTDK